MDCRKDASEDISGNEKSDRIDQQNKYNTLNLTIRGPFAID